MPNVCTIDRCAKPVHGRGLCQMHYRRWKVEGDPGSAEPRRAPNGSGCISSHGYRKFHRNRQVVLEHRDVMERLLGRPLLPQESVHHKNGDRSDNRPENLELWSKSQPAGQRVTDKVAWAIEILSLYAPASLNPETMNGET